MNDTTPRAEKRLRELMMQRTPGERFKMASSMFDAARLLVLAGIKADHGEDLDPVEVRVQLFLRTYGSDLSPHRLLRVVERIRRQGSAH